MANSSVRGVRPPLSLASAGVPTPVMSILLATIIALAGTALFANAAPAQSGSSDETTDLQWRSIGPSISGGRIADLEVTQHGEQLVLYVGAASGGVFRSKNHGTSWEPLFDEQANLGIGDITVAPSDSSAIWVGTGEPNNRNSSTVGRGVYRSTDGGETWTLVGLEETRHVGEVLVHPDDPETVWVAALGHLFGPNEERGVFKTTDGGDTWEKVLYVGENTGAVSLEMPPGQSSTILAATYQRRRRAYGFVGGGPGSGIYRSTDGGETWSEVTEGLPEGDKGRIGFNTISGRPDLVMAMVEAREEGGVYRSTDAGQSWEHVNDLNPRPMYYSKIRMDPNDPDRMYVLGTQLHRSEDGGEKFETVPLSENYNLGVHSDQHDLWIDPSNSNHMIMGNDGGLYFTHDGDKNWEFAGNLPIGQFYDITTDMATPYRVYGGLQDNQSYIGPSQTRHYRGILNRDWTVTGFGDGMYQQVDPTDNRTLYTSSQNGAIIRFDLATGDRKDVKPVPEDTASEYRFDWTAPILLSDHDPSTVYFGGNRLFISRDGGVTWTETPDLTRDLDRDTLPIMGSPPDSNALSLHDGVGGFSEITTLAESPAEVGILWVGTDDGLVQVSRDGGKTWREVGQNIPGPSPMTFVSRVDASHSDPGRAYATLDGHWDDDYRPHVYVTEDYGQTWRDISPAEDDVGAAKVVREHPLDEDVLFLGTATGVMVTRDGGQSWSRLNRNMPRVPVWDLEIHPRTHDLVAGTHGRSIWILDDIGGFAQLPESEAGDDQEDRVSLLDMQAGTLHQKWSSTPSVGHGQFEGENPPVGATITFWMPEGRGDSATVIVRSPNDQLYDRDTLRVLHKSAQPGVNRIVWDLRLDSLPADSVFTEHSFELPGDERGPLVAPGTFPVEVTVGGERVEGAVAAEMDSHSPASRVELRDRYRFAVDLHDLALSTYESAVRSYQVEERVVTAVDSLDSNEQVGEEVVSRADSLQKRIVSVADSFRTQSGELRGWWRGLRGDVAGGPSVQGSMTAPTPSQERRLSSLKKRLASTKKQLSEVLDNALPPLNALLDEHDVDRVSLPSTSDEGGSLRDLPDRP